jgi:membrane-bound ClpP family serine protease
MGAVILLISLGILLFLIEFLLIPGITIAGIGGAILTLGGIYLAYSRFGAETGSAVLAGTLLVNVLILTLSLRSRTWKKAMLTTNIDSRVNEIPGLEKIKSGDRGVAVTRLAPMGTVKVNDVVFEAKSIAGFIDPKTEIEVVKITSAQVIVKPIK